MNLLLIAEIEKELPPPPFGGEFAAHIAARSHPQARRASLCAWNLLACGLRRLGARALPEVRFEARGKPTFARGGPHFSLAHSGVYAAALISDAPCGVDVERVRMEVAERLRARCLSEDERALGMDFFEAWTKKECIGKLDGGGIGPRPAGVDSLDARWRGRFFTARLSGSDGCAYALAALCERAPELRVERVSFLES